MEVGILLVSLYLSITVSSLKKWASEVILRVKMLAMKVCPPVFDSQNTPR